MLLWSPFARARALVLRGGPCRGPGPGPLAIPNMDHYERMWDRVCFADVILFGLLLRAPHTACRSARKRRTRPRLQRSVRALRTASKFRPCAATRPRALVSASRARKQKKKD